MTQLSVDCRRIVGADGSATVTRRAVVDLAGTKRAQQLDRERGEEASAPAQRTVSGIQREDHPSFGLDKFHPYQWGGWLPGRAIALERDRKSSPRVVDYPAVPEHGTKPPRVRCHSSYLRCAEGLYVSSKKTGTPSRAATDQPAPAKTAAAAIDARTSRSRRRYPWCPSSQRSTFRTLSVISAYPDIGANVVSSRMYLRCVQTHRPSRSGPPMGLLTGVPPNCIPTAVARFLPR